MTAKRTRNRVCRAAWGVIAGLSLAACASGPPDPRELSVFIQASDQVNPNEAGEPSPVSLTMYELSNDAQFLAADFFALYEQDVQTLGGQLIRKRDYQLRPGEKVSFTTDMRNTTTHLAFLAGYRQIENADWRSVLAVDGADEQAVYVALDLLAVSATHEDKGGWFFGLF